jgi:Trypsin
MQARSVIATALLTAALGAAGPATAVTDGDLDGAGHPHVGLMIAKDVDGNPLWRCSGTLMRNNLFLTAGHCTEAPAHSAEVWFNSDEASIRASGYPSTGGQTRGRTYTHPQFDPAAFFRHDLGVVVLDVPVNSAVYGRLPRLGDLDQLAQRRGLQDVTFTAVGYGLQQSSPVDDRVVRALDRMLATPRLLQINSPGFTGDYSMLLSNNHATGGTCFGDSGGPNFMGNTNVVAGVTSFGLNGNCGGTGGVYRLDTADDLDWLAGTFGLVP